MTIHETIKSVMKDHKQKIELTQWAIISGISSLFYSEYIRRFKHKEVPVRVVLVPSIKNLSNYLKPDSEFMEKLSNDLITDIAKHPLMQEYLDAPELVMFKEENIEILKTIYDLYISQNITRRIPETVSIKFGLNNENQQVFRETWEIDLFDNKPIDYYQYNYIVEQIVLQLLMLIPSMKKEIEIPEDHINIQMTGKEILTISNDNAICPIHFNIDIIDNKSVNKLLSFVTNTKFDDLRDGDIKPCKGEDGVDFMITTGLFNKVMLTKFTGIFNPELDLVDTTLRDKSV